MIDKLSPELAIFVAGWEAAVKCFGIDGAIADERLQIELEARSVQPTPCQKCGAVDESTCDPYCGVRSK